MRSKQRTLWLLATMTLLSCGRAQSTTTVHPAPVTRALTAKPHRLAVVFWPQLSGCNSCDQLIAHVVTEWQTERRSEIAVVSVIPSSRVVDRLQLPGEIVRLKPEDYERHAGSAPRPRIEIWSASGELLLSRSVPNYGSQMDLLHEEFLAARSYTAPVIVASRRQP